MNIIKEIETRNIEAAKCLYKYDNLKWTVWTQDGPSDDTMLVCDDINTGILFCELLGYTFYPLHLRYLKSSGWVCVGEL